MPFVVSTAQMAAVEQRSRAADGLPDGCLMERAGCAVANFVRRLQPRPCPVAVACGSGNNGGDGLVAAVRLAGLGYAVKVWVFAAESRLQGDAARALVALQQDGRVPLAFDATAAQLAAAPGRVLIDALLGIGLTSAVRPPLAAAIACINQRSEAKAWQVVSVDLPSGIHTETGQVLGCAVQAHHTVTFGCAKWAHYLHPGAAHRGRLHLSALGLQPAAKNYWPALPQLLRAGDGQKLVPRRAANCHKGTFGHLVAVAGSANRPGAARLLLSAALRSGAGLVSWAADAALLASHGPQAAPEAMLRPLHRGDPAAQAATVMDAATAVAVGPGLGTDAAAEALLAAILQQAQVPLCLDADALTLLADHPALWQWVRSDTVLTPHPKEMARLLGPEFTAAQVQQDRLGALQTLVQRHSCTVVLKGAHTLLADAQGHCAVVGPGSPALATGGTGDVLCGLLGGLLAQQLPPWEAAQAAVLLHACSGEVAARRVGQAGVVASDVTAAVGEVWRAWNR
jgi:hydroxyethylthiazole kinase-like uncharacterized protein yjeF